MSATYAEFLATKRRVFPGVGITPPTLSTKLFDWQAAVVRWALRKGKAAVFADCGLGKSFMQVSWAAALDVPTIVFAPLVVGEQTVKEAKKLGVRMVYAADQASVGEAPLVITNYERLHKFDLSRYQAVVLDESSILKSFNGATRTALIEACKDVPYRLCCTATPSPNDIAELANHAEFLGLMTRPEFLATWFVHDDQGWRMKRHAVQPFYRWMASWAMAFRRPSDIGYDDTGFTLPPLRIHDEVVESGENLTGCLFPEAGLKGIQGRLSARRGSLKDRVEATVELVLKSFHAEAQASILHAGLAQQESGARQSVSISDTGAASTTSAGAIRAGRMAQGKGSRASKRMGKGTSESTQTATDQSIRDDDRAIRGDARETEMSLCDLRMVGSEQADSLSIGRSLPYDATSQGSDLPELQLWYRELSGQCAAARESGALPKWLIWCGLNTEQDAIAAAFGSDCVSISGNDSYQDKTDRVIRWINDPTLPICVSKVSVLGFGMNFQHCHNAAFVGMSDSYEGYYQAIRRLWRFGQQSPVDIWIIVSDAERMVVDNVRRKEATADSMAAGLIEHMADFEREELAS